MEELAWFDDVFEAIRACDEIKEIDPFAGIDEFGGIHRIQIISEISKFWGIDPFPRFGDIEDCGSETHYPRDIRIMKRFLWPSYHLIELACIGRFCLNISNGSCFTTLKLRMYPTTF